MPQIDVQFADDSDTVIVSYFGAPQDPSNFPNLGTVDVSDERWKTYFAVQPPWVQPYLPAPQ